MTVTEKMHALRRSPMFAGVEENELLLLAEAAQMRTYQPGTVICRGGECPTRLYALISGKAKFGDGETCPGIFDIAALLYDRPLERDIVAAREICCLTFSKGHFFTLVNECPIVLLNVMREVL